MRHLVFFVFLAVSIGAIAFSAFLGRMGWPLMSVPVAIAYCAFYWLALRWSRPRGPR